MTTKKIEALAARALKADLKVKELTEAAKNIKIELKDALEAAGMYNPDTKAIGDVKFTISPNRFFDSAKAWASLSEEDQKATLVAKPDPALVKAHLTPIQLENFMVEYADPFKMGLKPLTD